MYDFRHIREDIMMNRVILFHLATRPLGLYDDDKDSSIRYIAAPAQVNSELPAGVSVEQQQLNFFFCHSVSPTELFTGLRLISMVFTHTLLERTRIENVPGCRHEST